MDNKAKLAMVKGDTKSFLVEIEGLEQDLDTAFFSVKKNPNDEEYILQKTLSDGITKVETGKYRVRVAPQDTRNVETGTYHYDLQIGIGDDIYTIMRGKLDIVYEITEEY